ncbi:MAG: DUF4347 domain-containing protein, partial [Planctomycetota bacterium]
MSLQITRLEERIVLEGSGLNIDDPNGEDNNNDDAAVAPDSEADSIIENNDASDTNPVDALTSDFQSQQAEEVSVLVVTSSINDYSDLIAAANDNVRVVEYNSFDTTLSQLLDQITEALDGEKADKIGFAVHGEDGALDVSADGSMTLSTLLFSQDQQNFWSDIGEALKSEGRIDLFACNLAGNEQGQLLVSEIESLTGADVAASDDVTGNSDAGGDWILETDNVDVENEYFDSEVLDNFDGVLAEIPSLTLTGAITYDEATEQGTNKALDTGATAQEDGDNWDGGNITVAFTAGSYDANDVIGWDASDLGNGAATLTELNGNNIDKIGGGKTLAVITQAGDGTQSLIITFTSADTGSTEIPDGSEINEILQHIVYSNNSDTPLTGAKTLTWTITDNTTDNENSGGGDTTTVTLTDSNDDPTNAGTTPADQSFTEDVQGTLDLSNINLSDVDDGGAAVKVRITAT